MKSLDQLYWQLVDKGSAVRLLALLSNHYFVTGAVKDTGQIHQVREGDKDLCTDSS